jgi:biotin carboxyl carrier protein
MHAEGWEIVRHALEVARERGFGYVRVKGHDMSFEAEASPVAAPGCPAVAVVEPADPGPATVEVCAPAVGYFRERGEPLMPGREVEAGEVLGEIVALGIANDVAAPASGVVEAVLVGAGDAVDFGRPLAVVAPR